MKITVANFANEEYRLQQRWNSFSAKHFGRADRVRSFSPNDIKQYLDQHCNFKKYKRGFGNYFWKPYVIHQALENVDSNDFLFYCDSGAFILKNLRTLAAYLDSIQKDILAFKLPLIERQWTKRDAFILLDADDIAYTDSPQLLATFMMIKKTEKSLAFVENFRQACLDERVVSDLHNLLGKGNYPEFVAHRHDQSVFSILGKKSSIVAIEGDPSDCGFFPRPYLQEKSWMRDDFHKDIDNYKFKNFVISNRKIHPIMYLTKFVLKRLLYSVNLFKRYPE